MKRNKLVSLAMAFVFSLSCFLVSAAASSANSGIDLNFGENGSNFTYTILDENGNPVPTLYDLPFDGSGNIQLRSQYTIVIADTNGGPFYIPTESWIGFDLTLSTRNGIAFGYQKNGVNSWEYDGEPSIKHQGEFRTSGTMKFIIKNTSASTTTLTKLHIG